MIASLRRTIVEAFLVAAAQALASELVERFMRRYDAVETEESSK